MRSVKFIYLFLLIGGAIFMAVGIKVFSPSLELMMHGISSTGVVTDLVQGTSYKGENTYAPTIRYTCGTKDTISTSDLFSSPPMYSVGDTVSLFCSEKNPEKFILDNFMERYFGLIFITIGLIEICIGFGIFLYEQYRNKTISFLKSNGEHIKGKVTSIGKNRFITVLNKHPYIIEAEYYDSMNHLWVFKSDNIWDNPNDSIHEGDSIGIYVDRGNYKKYWVDTSFLLWGK